MSSYPGARRVDLIEDLPADAEPKTSVADPYRWLEDGSSQETTQWSAAQTELFERHRERWPGREHVADRMRRLLGAGVVTAPVHRGDRVFFMRRTGDQEHAILYVREDGSERVVLDPMQIDPTGATTLDAWQPSKEGNLLAYQVSEGGSEQSILRVLQVATGDIVDGPIDRARYSPVAWLRGEQEFYYVRRLAPDGLPEDERQYHRRVWLHRVGTPAEEDVEIFGSGRPIIDYYGASVSWDGRWLVISAASGTDPRNDVWFADLGSDPSLTAASPTLREVIVGADARTGVLFTRDADQGRMYIHTDLDAPRGRICAADPAHPGPEHWTTLVGSRDDAVLEDLSFIWPSETGTTIEAGADRDGGAAAIPADRELLVAWTSHAVAQVTTHRRNGEQTGEIALPGLGAIGSLVTRPTGGGDVWFSYTDHFTLPTVYRYDVMTEDLSIHAAPPGAVEVPASVTARQVTYQSSDGTDVRMFILAPAGLIDPHGNPTRIAPTTLYGYGGFGLSLNPGFSAGMLTWVEAGGVYAVANLRGGGEEGEEWHRAGMLGNKQNVYDDFHCAAEYLISRGWASTESLSISGGSNGGLLVGAALTQRPERFGAVVCSAPLLDMVRYQLTGLGATWAGEYGDAADPEELRWLHAYSPYHRAATGIRYPAVLFTTFDADSRVDPLHARKLAAALQHATSSDVEASPILVRTESNVGHGARALSKSIELTADTLAFAAFHTGLSWE